MMLSSISVSGIALVMGAAALCSACGPGPGADLLEKTRPKSGKLAGQPCEAASAFDCYPMKVPLNHQDPESPTITVTFAVHPAEGERQGALLIPGGGPGENSIDGVAAWLPKIDRRLRQQYDIVSFDLRGVFRSGGLDCPLAYEKWLFTPQRAALDADREKLLQAARDFATECPEELGLDAETLAYYATAQAVEDIESFRRLRAYENWTVYAYSYGTQLMQTYGRQYPERVKLMALDGTVNLAMNALEFDRQLNEDQNELLGATFRACDATRSCTRLFKTSAQKAYDRLFERLLRLDSLPLTVKGADGESVDTRLTAYDFDFASSSAVGRPRNRSALLVALSRYDQTGDIEPLYRLADGSSPLLRSARSGRGMSSALYYTFICNDYGKGGHSEESRVAAYLRSASVFEQGPARIRSVAYQELPCAFWPSAPDYVRRPHAALQPDFPILLIAASGDAAVPFRQTLQLKADWPHAALLKVAGGKHIMYGTGLNCVDQKVTPVLLKQTLEEGAISRCEGDFLDFDLLKEQSEYESRNQP